MEWMKKRKFFFSITVIVFIGILCSLYFYNQLIHITIPIHSDDAGTATDIRDIIELGNTRWSYWLSPFNWVNGLLYYWFGATEFFLQSFFVFKYFVCITISVFLAMYNEKKITWYFLPLFLFLIMPGCFGTASIHPLKFHVWTIAIPLICLAYILVKGNNINKLNKCNVLVLIMLSVIGIIERDILIVITCWCPFGLYWLIVLLQKGYVKKYIKYILLTGSVGLVIGRFFFAEIIYMGYGANKFTAIRNIFENVLTGISGFLSMFNINLEGNYIIQFSTIIGFIRIVVLFIAFGCVYSRIKELCVKKIENISVIDSIMTISVIVLIFAYLLGGYREDAISIRYVAYLYYIIPVLMCRKLNEIFDEEKIIIVEKQYNYLLLFVVVCIVVSLDTISFSREKNTTDFLAEKLENIEYLDCGMGSFWSSGVVSVLTNYNVNIQAGIYDDDYIVPYLSEWDVYRNGNRFFNFFIEDPDGDGGINEESITKLYGSCKEKFEIEGKKIYLFDYDIRTKPLILNSKTILPYVNLEQNLRIDNNKIILDPNDMLSLNNLLLSVGKIRLIVKGNELDSLLRLNTNKSLNIVQKSVTDKKIIFDVDIDVIYNDLTFELVNKGDATAKIDSISIMRLENSVKLADFENTKLFLTPGHYIIAMEGQNMKNSSMLFEMDSCEVEVKKINNGNQKVAYELITTEEGILTINSFVKGDVKEAYYQNEICKDLNLTEKKIFSKGNGIYIRDGLLYGPYIALNEGFYCLDIYGTELDKINIKLQHNGGMPFENAVLVEENNKKISYILNVIDPVEMFEVIITKNGESNINVNYYSVEKLDETEHREIEMNYGYDSASLVTTGTIDVNEQKIILQKDEICYGPYITLPRGEFELELSGENLNNAEITITCDSGKKIIQEVTCIENENRSSKYEFKLDCLCENVEIVIRNKGDQNIELDQYRLIFEL